LWCLVITMPTGHGHQPESFRYCQAASVAEAAFLFTGYQLARAALRDGLLLLLVLLLLLRARRGADASVQGRRSSF